MADYFRSLHPLWKKIQLHKKVIVTGIILIPVCILAVLILQFTRAFLSASDLTLQQIQQKIAVGLHRKNNFDQVSGINFVFLSLDHRNDALEKTLLTDTILFGSYKFDSSSIKMIPIPRDLWVPEYKSKINNLYYYGQQRGIETGETNAPEFVVDSLATIIGQDVHYWLVLEYQDFSEIIDIIGGIDVEVEHTFTDTEFPNPEHILDQSKPTYITVHFEKGLNHLDGEQALQYVRSRKSTDIQEGSDIARSNRQARALSALMTKMRSREVVTSGETLGKLYAFWNTKVQKNIQDEDLLGLILRSNKTQAITIDNIQIPQTFEAKGEVLVHPPVSKYGQWVFETEDGSWTKLQQFIADQVK